jgi:hypothetical protein
MFAGTYADTNEHLLPGVARERHPLRRALPPSESPGVGAERETVGKRAGLRHTQALISGENESLVDLVAKVMQVSAGIGIHPLRPR